MDEKIIQEALRAHVIGNTVRSLDKPLPRGNEDGEMSPMSDFVPAPPENDEERVILENRVAIEHALSQIDARYARVIWYLHRLDNGGSPRSSREVGRMLGISQQTVLNWHRKGMALLKSGATGRMLREIHFDPSV